MKYGLCVGSPTSHCLEIPLNLHNWCKDDFIVQLLELISSLQPSLRTIPLSAEAPRNGQTVRLQPSGNGGFQRTVLSSCNERTQFSLYSPCHSGMKKIDLLNRSKERDILLLGGFGLMDKPNVDQQNLAENKENKSSDTSGNASQPSSTPMTVNITPPTNTSSSSSDSSSSAAISSTTHSSGKRYRKRSYSRTSDQLTLSQSLYSSSMGHFTPASHMLHSHVSGTLSLSVSSNPSLLDDAQSLGDTSAFALMRNCALIVFIRQRQLIVWTYNWKSGECVYLSLHPFLIPPFPFFLSSSETLDQLSKGISRLIAWNLFRQQFLSHLLHQKMGLFHHCVPRAPAPPPLITNFSGLNAKHQKNSYGLIPLPSSGPMRRSKSSEKSRSHDEDYSRSHRKRSLVRFVSCSSPLYLVSHLYCSLM
jgi:hypothetical protein